jgi:hypothetical protein
MTCGGTRPALRSEAIFVEAALVRGDLRAAGSNLVALAERAWTIFRQQGIGIGVGIGLTVNFIPGATYVKLAIAAGKVIEGTRMPELLRSSPV